MVLLVIVFEGKWFNSFNDLVYDWQGNFYFMDFFYGLLGIFDDSGKELFFQGVYWVFSDGKFMLLMKEFEVLNGFVFLLDYQMLYVVNLQVSLLIWKVYFVKFDGSLGLGWQFVEVSVYVKKGDGVFDGLKVDVYGNVFVIGLGGVYVFVFDGKWFGCIIIDVFMVNVVFGEDGSMLFIMVNHCVLCLCIRMNGMLLFVVY